ncbi:MULTISPECIES: hypothetical protein [unclassified Beijerinckia]|uniref:hypothetical protein n=1 Tax=unclassified Beijerinckia TaxID=2638183 RepID=UPI000895ADBB|nr:MULTISPECIES: hypothetical protein [unclassified Beijerinckia]MDH7797492.1 hypothetical protein [Beijerinckia sp. GAS462]SEC87808.1 hypothetical protein SAMN05443249_3787 [Beijerinckia sp. 28-YEA-48]
MPNTVPAAATGLPRSTRRQPFQTPRDPAFEAIRRHAAINARAESCSPDDTGFDGIASSEGRAFSEAMTTRPTTIEGAIALLDYALKARPKAGLGYYDDQDAVLLIKNLGGALKALLPHQVKNKRRGQHG